MRFYDYDYFISGKTSNWTQGYTLKSMIGVHRQLHTWIHQFFPGHYSMLVLGCALGVGVLAAKECGDPAVGVDWTPLLGKHKLSRDLVRASATHLPFRDQTFDLCVNSDLMEHIPEEQTRQVLEEQKRVCRAHFFTIAAGQPNPGERDIGHINIKPVAWWLEQLNILGEPKHTRCSQPPNWDTFMVSGSK